MLTMQNFYFPILFLLALNCSTSAFGQTLIPHPDTSFNGTGAIYFTENKHYIPQTQAIQADGKILTGGYGRPEPNSVNFDVILYRINPDGSRDTEFGTDGRLTIDITGTNESLETVRVLPDNKILLLVNANHEVYFVRLLPDGSFDPDFGLEGFLLADTNPNEYFLDMEVQPDGKIVIAGSDAGQNGILRGVIRRFNPDGTVDAGFGLNGYRDVAINATLNLEFYDVIFQPDGKILATGYYAAGAPSGFPVVRLNTDGSFDQSFSGDGIFLKTLGLGTRTAYAESLALQPDGKIVVCGYAPKTVNEVALTVIRLRPDGTIESSFGSFGVARVVYSFFAAATSVIIQPDNKILMTGYCYVTDTSTYATITRLNTNGQPDTSFGFGEGRYAHLWGNYPVLVPTAADLDKNGKLVETVWENSTINIGSSSSKAKGAIDRQILDITVGAHEAAYLISSASISPNPVTDNDQMTLKYTLDNNADISVTLFNAEGRPVRTLLPMASRTAGTQTETFYFPPGLPAGNYFVVLSGGVDYQSIPVIKY